jgi:hypothetical protein
LFVLSLIWQVHLFRFIYAFGINENEVCMLKLSFIYRWSWFTVKKRKQLLSSLFSLSQKISTQAVRFFFDSKVPGHTLESFLKQHRSNLTSYRSVYRCTKDQEAKLFPGEFFLIAMSINIGRNILITISDSKSVYRSNLA